MENFDAQFAEWHRKHEQKTTNKELNTIAEMLKNKEMCEIYSNNGVKASIVAMNISFVCENCGAIVETFSCECKETPEYVRKKRYIELLEKITKPTHQKTLIVEIPCHTCGKINQISYDIPTTEDFSFITKAKIN